MSRASTLARAIGSDGALNVADVAGLAAVASSGSASDLSTGTLPIARVADGAVTAAKLASGVAVSNLGFTPALRNVGDAQYNASTLPNLSGITKNSISYKIGAFADEPEGLPYNSLFMYLSTNGMGGTHNSTDERAVQLRFADVKGNHYIRVKQGDSTGWHSWERLLTSRTPGTLLNVSYNSRAANTTINTTTWTDIWSITYTPVSNSSYLLIWIHVNLWNPNVTGGTGDAYLRLNVDGSTTWENGRVAGNFQFDGSDGLHSHFNNIGQYTNSSTSAKTLTLQGALAFSGGAGATGLDYGHSQPGGQQLIIYEVAR